MRVVIADTIDEAVRMVLGKVGVVGLSPRQQSNGGGFNLICCKKDVGFVETQVGFSQSPNDFQGCAWYITGKSEKKIRMALEG